MTKKKKLAIIISASVVGALVLAVAVPFTILGIRTAQLKSNYSYLKTDTNYSTKVEVTGIELVKQHVSCGYASIEMISDYYGYNLITGGNRWCADVNYWTPDNPTNEWPRASSDIANRGLCANLKGDYIKIQDLTFGYDFSRLINKSFGLKVSKARIYCQMRNCAYLYKAAGHNINPESTSTELTVPQSYNFGVNINF